MQSSGKEYNYRVPLTYTQPNYGGKRWWFTCPNTKCQKRVGVLYFLNEYFICRHCCNLAYTSQNETKLDRVARKAQKIAEQLDCMGNVVEGFFGLKPKGMHHKTYKRKQQQLEYYENLCKSLAYVRFGIRL